MAVHYFDNTPRTTLFFSVFLLLLLLVPLLPTLSLADDCRPKDRSALLKIRYSFSNPELLPSWDAQMDCCYIIGCDETSHAITDLTLTNSQLAGSIPVAIADLTDLRTLRLHKMPNLVGPIPPAIATLKQLVSLTISWANISGPVPSFLAQLHNLLFLDLSFNRLSGSIPPELANMPKIIGIDLSRNRLTGTIPESFGRFVGTVPSLILSHNRLSGEIPQSLGDMNFDRIDFSRNNLVGDALMLFNASKTTQIIDISRNKLEFDFSGAGFSAGSLVTLDVSHNKIRGNIPAQITEAVFLQFLNVSYNRLCGKIPTGWKLRYRSEPFDESSFSHNRCLCGAPLAACKIGE